MTGYRMDENDPDSKFLRLQFSRKPSSRPGQRGRRWWALLHQPNGNLLSLRAPAAASLLARRDTSSSSSRISTKPNITSLVCIIVLLKAKPESRETNILECVEAEEIETYKAIYIYLFPFLDFKLMFLVISCVVGIKCS